jgi:O-antigen/teichoic acid export membrane protein
VRLSRDILLIAIAQGLAGGALLLSFFVLARRIEPDAFGEAATAYWWAMTLGLLGHVSVGAPLFHALASGRKDAWPSMRKPIITLLSATAGATLLVTFLAVQWHPAGLLRGINGGLLWGGLPISVVAMADHVQMNRAAGQGRGLVYSGWLAVGRLASLVAIGALPNMSAMVALVVLACGGLVAIAGQAATAPDRDLASGPPIRLLRPAFWAHMNVVGSLVTLGAMVLIVQAQVNAEAAGHFQVAFQAYQALLLVPTAFALHLAGSVGSLGPNRALDVLVKALRPMALLVVGVAAAGFVAAPLLPVLIGSDYAPALPVLRVLMLALPGISLSLAMASQWIGRGLFRASSLSSLAAGTIGLLVAIAATDLHGAIGAAWAIVTVSILALIVNGFFLARLRRVVV